MHLVSSTRSGCTIFAHSNSGGRGTVKALPRATAEQRKENTRAHTHTQKNWFASLFLEGNFCGWANRQDVLKDELHVIAVVLDKT